MRVSKLLSQFAAFKVALKSWHKRRKMSSRSIKAAMAHAFAPSCVFEHKSTFAPTDANVLTTSSLPRNVASTIGIVAPSPSRLHLCLAKTLMDLFAPDRTACKIAFTRSLDPSSSSRTKETLASRTVPTANKPSTVSESSFAMALKKLRKAVISETLFFAPTEVFSFLSVPPPSR